ncbi:GNAT family N-acetyltransferase [Stenotrophomonas sp. S48]|uniref:GNAT family N-acetyltransferase n=1 Tax=unclassified Stenotrophomonas TaxID=196198 RepID=UPI001901F6FF|nr:MULTISPECIES: GNAT family protein [unclassified Stenotrophomonas]MBK0027395.1 GNAT family N-acetyltransferase [Stenotrophomonas sp. S48]MBK0048232.1 GNAT family N-acetyltransferase [Stenotrophomonas sp. S49]
MPSHSLLFPGLPLHSARLVLSPIRRDDAAALYALQSDAEVMRWWNHPAWTRPAEARAQIDDDLAAQATGTQLKLAVRESIDGPLLGICVVFALDRDARRAEIGYLLAPAQQGQGYMHEALQRLLDYLFQTLRLHRVEAELDPRNAPSAHVLERLGFAREGLLRQRWRIQGELADSVVYGLLADDDRAPRPA